MSGKDVKSSVGRAYLGDVFMRHPLTTQNQEELKIADKVSFILDRNLDRLKRTPQGGGEKVSPVGFSLNEMRYRFPDDKATAHERGWRAYLNLGVPLIEEEFDITQPPADMLSKQTYVNATDPVEITATDTVEFSISNTISWSLQGAVQLTFGAKTSAALQAQLQKSMAVNQSQKTTVKNSKDNIGVDNESQAQATSTTTETGSATGTGELSAQLMLGVTASVSGSLTTSWKHTSSLSLKVSSRIDVMATTRRQIRRFKYEIPVTFGGWAALYYPKEVAIPTAQEIPSTPQAGEPKYSHVLAWPLGELADSTNNFDMADEGKRFMQKGVAEEVAVRVGEHRVFQPETIDVSQKEPL
ncbi:gluconolaconase [Streptomyces sp. NPDC052309]|uniref:gluconolaconase n=1 Tax=Streptomyces sp. NPDC052309 TaxID=3155421 RepID=UPI0034254519